MSEAGSFQETTSVPVMLAAFTPTTLTIVGVRIDLNDGSVTFDEGVTQDEAARSFWRAVGTLAPWKQL